jgi:hypothetical protein
MLLEGLGKLEKSNDLIGNITRDLRGYVASISARFHLMCSRFMFDFITLVVRVP